MPDAQISNPAGVYGIPLQGGASWFNQEIMYCVNASGANMTTGMGVTFLHGSNALGGQTALTTTIVILNSVTLSTVAANTGDIQVVGIVGVRDAGLIDQQLTTGGTVTNAEFATFADKAIVPIIVRGIARVNIATNTVAVATPLVLNNTNGAGSLGASQATAAVGTIIAISLESQANKDTNNLIRAYVSKM